MEMPTMTLDQAVEYLDLNTEVVDDGTRLIWGSSYEKAGGEVTLSDAEDHISGENGTWEKSRKGPSDSPFNGKTFYVDTFSAWPAVKNHLQTATD